MKDTLKLKDYINYISNDLEDAGVSEPINTAKLIVSHVLKVNKMELFFVDTVTKAQKRRIEKIVALRKKHIPLQYITKEVEFLNGRYKVNSDVLIPRYETEQLADIVTKDINNNQGHDLKVLDLCTGSGVLGISIANNTTSCVTISDISSKALKVAKHNATKNNAKVNIVKSDLFKNIEPAKFDYIVTNPPYIKTVDLKSLERQVKDYEPITALNGGNDGLYFYKQILEHISDYLYNNGTLYMEHGIGQEKDIIKLCKDAGFTQVDAIKDYNNVSRFVVAKNLAEER